MIERLAFLWPEVSLFITTCVVMVLGLSRSLSVRNLTPFVTAAGLIIAGVLAWATTPVLGSNGLFQSGSRSLGAEAGQTLLPASVGFLKIVIAVVGVLLVLLAAGSVDRSEEAAIASGKRAFDPLRTNRAEFWAFFLFSLTGLMLCASADDLIWLFLALELTSLPTYIMVTISSGRNRAREAGVKYFFLGAMGAAVFLYGFALIYGATGSTKLNEIAAHFAANGLGGLGIAGLLMAFIGLSFKIAAVPMHFYTADVYEGAAPQVSGFLAFVPKTAGFIAIAMLAACAGWTHLGGVGAGGNATALPESIRLALWVIAALTMTVGNVLALLQTSVKRILAYSSISHSGYMLVGIIAGPGDGSFVHNGLAAVFFYLLAYGITSTGTFAVLAALERTPGPDGEPREVETLSDIRGLCASHPLLGWTLVLCSLSLLGLPPLLGFFGKLPLFTAAISAGEIPLVIILGINSAIAAVYYLKLAFLPLLDTADPKQPAPTLAPYPGRRVAAAVAAVGVVVLAVGGNVLMKASANAAAVGIPAAKVQPALGEDAAPQKPHAAAIIK